MALEYVLLVVEGPHDVAFVGRILRLFEGFHRIQLERDLAPFWSALVPRAYPPDGDLLKRVPVPSFFQSETHSVAVRSAIGDSKLAIGLAADLLTLGQASGLGAVGLIIDSDDAAPLDRHAVLATEIRRKADFTLPEKPGLVMGSPRRGCFVLPNNKGSGNLETVLFGCAEQVYPALFKHARAYVRQCEFEGSSVANCEAFQNEPARQKAVVSAISSILKPCKAIQTSIEDNDWISTATMNDPNLSALRNFLRELLNAQPSQA